MMREIVQLTTRKKSVHLDAMMELFAWADGRISFEGRLAHPALRSIEGAIEAESAVLKRNTTWPVLDFVILPLTPATVPQIQKAIRSRIGFGNNGIVHVQIERGGEVVFAAYDGFYEEGAAIVCEVTDEILDGLIASGAIWSYKRVVVEK